MLMSPPAPPKPSITKEKAEASMIGLPPRQRREPAEQAPPSAQATCDLDRSANGEDRDQGRDGDQRGEGGVDEFEARADLRVAEGVMDANRHRDDQESL